MIEIPCQLRVDRDQFDVLTSVCAAQLMQIKARRHDGISIRKP